MVYYLYNCYMIDIFIALIYSIGLEVPEIQYNVIYNMLYMNKPNSQYSI